MFFILVDEKYMDKSKANKEINFLITERVLTARGLSVVWEGASCQERRRGRVVSDAGGGRASAGI